MTINQTFGLLLAMTIFASCEDKTAPSPTLALISTTGVTQISTISAVSGGVITDDGGASIISKGICWNTAVNPTVGNNKTNDGGEYLSFPSNLSALLPSTTYYVRAYAVNSAGTSYGETVTFKTLGDKPVSQANSVTNTTINSVTLRGTINPNLLSTSVSFEWGTSITYGNTIIATGSPVSGGSSSDVSVDLTGLTPGTTYHFKIKATNDLGITISDDMQFTTLGQVPTIANQNFSGVTLNASAITGTVNPNYLSTTVSIDWGTSVSYGNTVHYAQNPLTGNTPINISTILTGLIPGTTYHFRIKATNELGTVNSADQVFTTLPAVIVTDVTDVDGNIYKVIKIGDQQWMQENLKTTKYNDGTEIPLVTSDIAWSYLSTPGYCWYGNDADKYKSTYGALYNFFAVNTGKLCPSGWHVPSDQDWTNLTTYLGGSNVAGGKLKETGTSHWATALTNNATNESGFTALPGGYRNFSQLFMGIDHYGYWWTSTIWVDFPMARVRGLSYGDPDIFENHMEVRNGLSVRCIKD